MAPAHRPPNCDRRGTRASRGPTRYLAAAAVSMLLATAACDRGAASSTAALVTGGDPDRGARIIRAVGCGSCHTIDGIPGANARVGPPLSDLGARPYVAGSLANNSDNLVRWIMDPQAIQPGTVMPDLSLSEAQARDVAAYLYGQ